MVIERSNTELELKLNSEGDLNRSERAVVHRILAQGPRTTVDTIHNHHHSLNQEIIYEANEPPPMSEVKPRSKGKLHSQMQGLEEAGCSQPSVAPSYPSISDLSANHDDVNFKSLTAQKLMAGLSFNSIDTLLEVNAAAEARTKLNESTETIPTHSVDFGVI